MDLIKKNIVLFVVLFLTLLLSGALVYLVWKKHGEMQEHMVKLVNVKKEIDDLNKENPKPVKENLIKINKDKTILEKKLTDIEQIFGKPYREPLKHFASEFGIDENELLNKWKKFWKKESKTVKNYELLKTESLEKFLKELAGFNKVEKKKTGSKGAFGKDKSQKQAISTKGDSKKTEETAKVSEDDKKVKDDTKQDTKQDEIADEEFIQSQALAKIDKALAVFRESVASRSEEYLDDNAVQEVLLESFGVPRAIRGADCKVFMSKFKERLNIVLKESQVNLGDGVANFTFDNFFQEMMPLSRDVPYIIKRWRMIENLVKILCQSKISLINSIKDLDDDLHGYEYKDYLTFKYSISISGTLQSVRDFVNNIQSAFKNNRVYIIKNLKITKSKDDVDSLVDVTETTKSVNNFRTKDNPRTSRRRLDPPFEQRGASSRRSSRQPDPRRPDQERDHIDSKTDDNNEKLPPEEDPNYGVPIIGTSKMVNVEIKFEYVIYVGDETKIKP